MAWQDLAPKLAKLINNAHFLSIYACIVDNYVIYHCGNLEDEMTLFYLVSQHALQQKNWECFRKITQGCQGLVPKSSTKGIYFVSRARRLFAGKMWIEKVGLGILFNLMYHA